MIQKHPPAIAEPDSMKEPVLASAARSPSRAKRPWRLSLRVVTLAAAGAVFFVFHGLSLHLSPWSQAFVNSIVKYTYSPAKQDYTTVVLFREENIRELGTQYPVPHAFHAQVLEALASYAPRAVFIDFAFIDPRQTEDTAALAAALCTLKNSRPEGTEVFLAAPAVANGEAAVLSSLRKCSTLVSPAIAGNQGVSGILTYSAGEHRKGGFVPSAAFATARALSGVDPEVAEGLEIIWGNGVAPLNLKWMGCKEPSLLEAAKEVLLHDPLALKKNCPYTPTVTVGHVLQSSGDRDVEHALKGRAVFYGAAFEFTGDRIASPVYAELPGVYLHAMAHDNLVTFGHHYKRAERSAVWLDFLVLLVTAALLVLLPRDEPWPHWIAKWLKRWPMWLRRPLEFLGDARPKVTTRREYLDRLVKTLWVLALLAIALTVAFQFGGMEPALWVALLAYVAYRIGVTRDAGFFVFVMVMIGTGFFAYSQLDLGPRNVLAYFAFFEGVRFLQERLAHAREVWRNLGRPPTPSKFHDSIDSVLALFGTEAEHQAASHAAPAPPS